MKKFFQNGLEPPRTPVAHNGYSPQLHTMSSTGYLAAPLMAAPSPRTPQNTSSHQQYFDLQRSVTISPSPSSTMLIGSGVLASIQNIPPSPGGMSQSPETFGTLQGHTIERNDMHRGLKSLETLLATLDEYRDLKNKLAKSEKRLAKNLSELSKSKMLEDIPSQTLQVSAVLFDSITETTSKHAKLLQKEYDSLNEHCGKYFKRVAKEERAHEELLDTLDSKVKRAHANHEKNTKKSGRIAIESHDKYIEAVQGLTQEISRAKVSHNASIGNKTFITSLVVASTLGGIADAEFRMFCEKIRKAGPHVGKLNEWLNFASVEGMVNIQPVDLNEDAMGWAQVLASKEAEIRDELTKQDQAKYAHLEHTRTLLKAQQMGWMPPDAQTQKMKQSPQMAKTRSSPATSMASLPRLDSKGMEVEPTYVSRTFSAAESKSSETYNADEKQKDPTPQEEAIEEEEKSPLSHQSSLADGTIVDREEVATFDNASSPMKSTASRDSSDAVTSKDSDDSANLSSSRSTAPSTPDEEMPPQDILINKGALHQVDGILKKPDPTEDEPKVKVERSADRYVDVHVSKESKIPVMHRSDSIEDRARRLSLWEHERERERQMEREAELQKRLMEAEYRLRTTAKDGYQREELRPRYSEPTRSYKSTTRHDDEIPAQRYEPERYAPALGSSRLSSGGVNRTLSTDSERSFVARMKARYQEEKGNTFPSGRPSPGNLKASERDHFHSDSSSFVGARHFHNSAPKRFAGDQRTAHAAGCECWSCSSHHYSNPAPEYTNQVSQQQDSKRQQPPPNHRRQTMPLLREDDRRSVVFANEYQSTR